MVVLSSSTGIPNEEGTRGNGHADFHVLGARSAPLLRTAPEHRSETRNTIATKCDGCITKDLRTRNQSNSEG